MKILVLDDEPFVVDALKGMLEIHGHEVDGASDAETAVEMVKSGKYDFVFFDYKLQAHDGIWFLQNAKMPRQTTALLVTSYGTRELINKCFQCGASGYLLKPFTESDLLHHIEFHSQKKKKTVIARPPPGVATPAT
jgi:DNA-binding response OmpR family regulator